MADAVTVLRDEIATFEGEITKRRQALALLTGVTTPPQRRPAGKRPAAKRPPAKSVAVKSPAPRSSTPASPSLAARILIHLRAHKGKLFTSAQVTEELAKTDKGVTRENVQRCLSELFNLKQVTREDGRYSVA
jgi:hypothetical protein